MPNILDLNLVWLIPALPLLGMLITGLFGRVFTRSGQRLVAAYLAAGMVTLSLLLSILVAINVAGNQGAYNYNLYAWIPSGDFTANIGFWVDGLTAVMLLV